MLVVMEQDVGENEIGQVCRKIQQLGYTTHIIRARSTTVIAAIGHSDPSHLELIQLLPGVEKAMLVLQPFKLAGREVKPEDTIIDVNGVSIGGMDIVVMAGPCAVENRDQIVATARAVKEAGAQVLRGGAFKPRTSPYSFQGLAEEGLKLLKEARDETGLPVVTEVMNPQDVELVASYADILQIGARNMQNYGLLREAGKSKKPVLLKRGLSATIEEWLMSAEYVMCEGNYQVILCERGIRTYDDYTRNTLDLAAIAVVKQVSHLPVIADPSHATGKWKLVLPMSKAAIMAGADGLLIEVHPNPGKALSDGAQSLTFDDFRELMRDMVAVANVAGRRFRKKDGRSRGMGI